MVSSTPVAVLGAGSWGTALAILLARNGHTVRLWGHVPEVMEAMAGAGCNREYLPDNPFPPGLTALSDLKKTLSGAREVLVVVPSHAFREVLALIQPLLEREVRIAWATKGLETGTGRFLHEVFREVIDGDVPCAVVSGPSFAGEVASGLPTAVTVASETPSFANDMAQLLSGNDFRAYTSPDVQGVELGGAVKNVLAIAAGISDGLGFGANSRAALITRGLHEIMVLGERLGGHRETFMGLAGMGDLVLTCTDNQSRNRRLGLALGEGRDRDTAIAEIGQAVEGFDTAREVVALAKRMAVEMPISEQVFRVLFEDQPPRAAVHELFSRSLKPEGL